MACPVCFEVKESSEIMFYASMSNHSWENSSRCDAHGICWDCMSRYVEIQILEEGNFNPRCPGEHCKYRLVPLDVERALERSSKGSEALERFKCLRSECHENRLKELLEHQGPNEAWLLAQSQPCPECLTLVRREEGCLHVFCRCGCDFCYGCGGPATAEGCICDYLQKTGDLVFAAWLRTSPQSPVAWLQDNRANREFLEVPEEKVLNTLHFFLWMAHADVSPPWKEVEHEEEVASLVKGLEPIRWFRGEDWTSDDECSDDFFTDDENDDYYDISWGKLPQKPMPSHSTQRQLRRSTRGGQRPLHWATGRVGPKTGGSSMDGQPKKVVAPLQPQRQPRSVAAATRDARRRARQSAGVSRRNERWARE